MAEYSKKYPNIVKEFIAASGTATDRAIAAVLGVSREAVRKWRTYNSGTYKQEFAAAIEQGKEAIDAGKIKKAMIKRACGFKTKEVVKDQVVTKFGEVFDVEKTITRTVAGDVAAAKYVLNNIGTAEDRWVDKNNVEHSGNVDIGLQQLLGEIDGSGLKPGI